MAEAFRIGIDLGGTKIEAAVLGDDGAVRARRRVATPRDDYAATLRSIAALVEDLEAEMGSAAVVGVGMPGTISPATGLVKNANSVWLNGHPLAEDLRRLLPRPLRLPHRESTSTLRTPATSIPSYTLRP